MYFSAKVISDNLLPLLFVWVPIVVGILGFLFRFLFVKAIDGVEKSLKDLNDKMSKFSVDIQNLEKKDLQLESKIEQNLSKTEDYLNNKLSSKTQAISVDINQRLDAFNSLLKAELNSMERDLLSKIENFKDYSTNKLEKYDLKIENMEKMTQQSIVVLKDVVVKMQDRLEVHIDENIKSREDILKAISSLEKKLITNTTSYRKEG